MTHNDGGDTPPQPSFAPHIRQAQEDAALLLNFLSGRKVRYLEELAIPPSATEPSKLQRLLDILAKAPEDIHRSTADWAHLLNMRDLLAQKASPATVESIRVTQSYIGRDKATLEKRHRQIAGWLKLFFYPVLTFVAWCVAILAICLLFHADNGERILAALDGLRAEHAAARTQAAQLFQDRDGQEAKTPASCEDDSKKTPFNRAQKASCDIIRDINRRMNLTYLQLEAWNRSLERFDLQYWFADEVLRYEARKRVRDAAKSTDGSAVLTVACPSPCGRDPCLVNVTIPAHCPAGLPAAAETGTGDKDRFIEVIQDVTSDWNRTELRTRLMLDGLGNYGIPTLLGFIGGAVFVFRRYWTLLEDWSLDGRERFLILFRPVLGAIIGGFASMFIGSVLPAEEGFRIAPGMFAFLCGYSVQFVFDLLDGFIERRLRLPPTTG